MIIKNYNQLAVTESRKQILRILEAGLESVKTENLFKEKFFYDNKTDNLFINQQKYDLSRYQKVVVIGFGKVSAVAAECIEQQMLSRISGGLVIDLSEAKTKKIASRIGTHPLPSSVNVDATGEIIRALEQLGENDLVIFIVSGGGSSLLTYPQIITLEQERQITQALMNAGANINQMNTVRKHLSSVKGGHLAKLAYPATVISLIFSDIPGDDISQVASGPTVKDTTTIEDATAIMDKYQVLEKCDMDHCGLIETPKDEKYFKKVTNILFCSSVVALHAMESKAHDLGLRTRIWDKAYSGEAKEVTKQFLKSVRSGECLLGAGESTVTIKGGKGSGGRNQEMAVSALLYLPSNTTFASLNSDGHDNSTVAGALADELIANHARIYQIPLLEYLEKHDEYQLLLDLNASIITGMTGINIADLIVAIKE